MKRLLRMLPAALVVVAAAGALAAGDIAVAVDGGPPIVAGRRGLITVSLLLPPSGPRLVGVHVAFRGRNGITAHDVPDGAFTPVGEAAFATSDGAPATQKRPGMYTIEVPFTVDARTPPGAVLVDGTVRYQACFATSCEPPVELHPQVTVVIAPRPTPR